MQRTAGDPGDEVGLGGRWRPGRTGVDDGHGCEAASRSGVAVTGRQLTEPGPWDLAVDDRAGGDLDIECQSVDVLPAELSQLTLVDCRHAQEWEEAHRGPVSFDERAGPYADGAGSGGEERGQMAGEGMESGIEAAPAAEHETRAVDELVVALKARGCGEHEAERRVIAALGQRAPREPSAIVGRPVASRT